MTIAVYLVSMSAGTTWFELANPSLVSYRHSVGYRRSPGDQPLPQSTLLGRRPTSLWSDVVVKLRHARLRCDQLLRSSSSR